MPTPSQGFSEKLLLGVENGFKTLPSPVNAVRIPVITPALKITPSVFRSNALTGVPQPRPIVYGKNKGGGSIDIECSKDSLMVPSYSLFGGLTEYGSAGNYDHRMGFSTMPSLFAEQQFLDIVQYILFGGIGFGKVQYKFAMEGLMEATFDAMFAKQAPAAGSTSVTGTVRDDTTADPFNYLNGVVSIAGTTVAYVQSATVTIDRQQELVGAIDGSAEMAYLISKIPLVSGQITALFEDATFLNEAVNSTEVSLVLEIPDTVLGHGYRLEIPTLKMMPTTPTTQGQGVVQVVADFNAYARGSASNVAARAGSKGFTSVTVVTGVSDTLVITFDTGVAQNFTLSAGALTPAGLVTALAGLTNGTAVVDNGRVILVPTTNGSAGTVAVSGNANTLFGFPAGPVAGLDAQAVVQTLTNGVAAVAP